MIINLMEFMTLMFCSYIWSTRSREFNPSLALELES